ncbi:MAG: hypothetical protein WC882_04075 [Candidatus Gracilibacteria bacterium]
MVKPITILKPIITAAIVIATPMLPFLTSSHSSMGVRMEYNLRPSPRARAIEIAPDNDDVQKEGQPVVQQGTLEKLEAGLANPGVTKLEDLGEDGMALIKDMIEVLRARQAINAQADENSDGIPTPKEVPVEAPNPAENSEQLDERLTACLEQLRKDFDRGIVKIDDEATLEDYTKALKADKTAGQKWETLEARLRANGADLLKKAAAMPEGACFIGVHADGTLAIRQRSREIVNVVITKEGQSVLLPHAEVEQYVSAQEGRQYAKAVEIVRGVEANGYCVPADSPNYEKKGLVAASDVVMGGNYVESPVTRNPQDREWRSSMLKCPDNTPDSAFVRVVDFDPNAQEASVTSDYARNRVDRRGAVLWLRG